MAQDAQLCLLVRLDAATAPAENAELLEVAIHQPVRVSSSVSWAAR